jgi:hypothetical protein
MDNSTPKINNLYKSITIKRQCYVHPKCENNIRKDVQKDVCKNLEVRQHTDGKLYCILHCPTKEKNIDKFNYAFQSRLKEIDKKILDIETKYNDDELKQKTEKELLDYDFRYIWFPVEVNLIEHEFKSKVYFNNVTFTSFTDFTSAKFLAEVYFSSTSFLADVAFVKTIFFDVTDFIESIFFGFADFRATIFEEKSQLFFINTTFKGIAMFYYANFKNYVVFEGNDENRVFIGNEAVLDLQNARIDDAKKISFQTVRLETSWFINNKDVSEFVFTDCQWRYSKKKLLQVKKEIKNLKRRGISNTSNEILTKACWKLADNHEESKSFSKASMFRKFANESKRLGTSWYKQPFTLHWWYYAVSFYGESWRRALIVLLCLLFGFGVLFSLPISKFDYGEKKTETSNEVIEQAIFETASNSERFRSMNLGEGIIHSLSVATFQRPEPKPADNLTKLFIVLEVIFAPLQAALLALAIRRKFMR